MHVFRNGSNDRQEEWALKRILVKFISVILLLAMLGIPFSAIAESGQQAPPVKKYTVMLYLCGSDLESLDGQASGDIMSIIQAGYNTEEINVVALLGGARKWMTGYSNKVLTVLEIGGRRPRVADMLPLSSMGEADTLTRFIDYCHEKYPAENYVLDLWDHGGGPIHGMMQDELFDGDSMSLQEVASALGNSRIAEKKLKMLVMSACLMSSAEVALMMAPYAEYMVASQDSCFGLTRTWIRGMDEDASIIETGKRLVDSAYEEDMQLAQANGRAGISDDAVVTSIAMIDLSKVEGLVAAMDAYFPEMEGQITASSFTRMSAQRRNTITFGVGESGGYSSRDLVDLGDLVKMTRESAPEKADALLSSLEEAVVYCRAADEKCSGLAVYHPFSNKDALSGSIPVYNDLEFSQGYTNYVHRFVSYLTGTPLASWKELRINAKAEKDMRSLFTLLLSDDQAAHLGAARMEVLRGYPDHTYSLTFINPEVGREGNTLTSEFSGTALYAVSRDGSILSPALSYSILENGAYVIKGRLTRNVGEGAEPMACDALIHCGYDAAAEALIPGRIQIWNEGMQAYSFLPQIAFEEYDALSITLEYRRETADENGILLPFEKWDVVRTEEWTAPIDDTWGFRLLHDTLDTRELYAAFRISDSQNNSYTSSLLQIKADMGGGAYQISYDDRNAVQIQGFFVTPAPNQLMLDVKLKNIGEQETWFRLEEFCINGQPADVTAEVFGSGAYWGLMPGESQSALIALPLADGQEADNISFSIVPVNAAEQADQPPVSVQALK